MIEFLPEKRNATRALIIKHDKVLLLRKVYENGKERFALPGGGQDTGESLKQTLSRECIEEIGALVKVGELIHVVDVIKLRDSHPPTKRHLIEFIFECTLEEGYVPKNGSHPDTHQVEVVWVDIVNLVDLSLSPEYLSAFIPSYKNDTNETYLGMFVQD